MRTKLFEMAQFTDETAKAMFSICRQVNKIMASKMSKQAKRRAVLEILMYLANIKDYNKAEYCLAKEAYNSLK